MIQCVLFIIPVCVLLYSLWLLLLYIWLGDHSIVDDEVVLLLFFISIICWFIVYCCEHLCLLTLLLGIVTPHTCWGILCVLIRCCIVVAMTSDVCLFWGVTFLCQCEQFNWAIIVVCYCVSCIDIYSTEYCWPLLCVRLVVFTVLPIVIVCIVFFSVCLPLLTNYTFTLMMGGILLMKWLFVMVLFIIILFPLIVWYIWNDVLCVCDDVPYSVGVETSTSYEFHYSIVTILFDIAFVHCTLWYCVFIIFLLYYCYSYWWRILLIMTFPIYYCVPLCLLFYWWEAIGDYLLVLFDVIVEVFDCFSDSWLILLLFNVILFIVDIDICDDIDGKCILIWPVCWCTLYY